ncbi:MAG: hypothetical protein HRU29_11645 [Rhizobiales bacterium]|nr:hypothetical protein [Hyphomicrobiales bacterium]NRB15043.1 hypothetical protein [Hyphomicrobiales bacterium]
MDDLQQGEVPFIVGGKAFTATMNIGAIEAIQEEFEQDAFHLIDEIKANFAFHRFGKLIEVILISNGLEKEKHPDFTKASVQGLIGLVDKLTIGTLGGGEVDAPEKKPPKKTAKKAKVD